MELSYIVTGRGLYVPQFKNKEGEWKPFTRGMIEGDMLYVCIALGNLSAPRRWDNGQWHFEDGDRSTWSEHTVFFTKPIYVFAFLGAAKHWWGEFKRHEVNL